MSESVLITRAWWADVAQRLLRQALQVAAPVLLAVLATTSTGTRVDVPALALALAGALTVTVVKALLLAVAGVTVTAGAPPWQQILDRAAPAAAGTLAAFVPLDFSGVLGLDPLAVLTAAVVSAVLAAVGMVLDDPARYDLTA